MSDTLAEMDDDDFFDLVHKVAREFARRARARQQEMPRPSDRAIRLPNSQTIAHATARVLYRAKQAGLAGLSKDEVARRVRTEEGYHTDTSGKKWTRSVYQSGIRPLRQAGVAARDSETELYSWVGPDINEYLIPAAEAVAFTATE